MTTPSSPDAEEKPDLGARLSQRTAHRAVASTAPASRFIAVFGILGTFVSALAIYLYGAVVVTRAVWEAMTHGAPSEDGLKHLTLLLIEATDSFLLATVLYIVSIGFVQLFVDSDLSVPGWMRILSLDQLKSKLVGVVVVLLSVTFLGKVMNWQGGPDIIYLGGAIALVTVALGSFGFRAHEDH